MGLRVCVVHAPAARQVHTWEVVLREGATVRDAVMASGLPDLFPQWDGEAYEVGIWGRRVGWDQPVRDQDRVELYRELRVDPKVARRERFSRQGARAAGLFAQRRPGGKAGY